MTTKTKATTKATTSKVTTKAATKPVAKATKVAAQPQAKKTSTPSTTFSLFAPEAHEVYLIGDFNDWRPDELKARRLKDGTWRKAVTLKPGTYQYLFLVDGQWWADPDNPARARNPFGTENSVIEIA